MGERREDLIMWFWITLAVVGWLLNILRLVVDISGPLRFILILRIIGVFFPPLGAILGFVGS